MKRSILHIILALIALTASVPWALAQRKITPVNNAATATQPLNEFEGDSVRIRERMLASMAHYHDENGNIVYVDTVTGREWRDSTEIKAKKPMLYPLLHRISVGVDLFNPVMRLAGQHYGVVDFIGSVDFHNRYIAVLEAGLGQADYTPADNNYTYRSPMSVYFRLGGDYNFMYNSDPDYSFVVGARYGLASFSYTLEDITIPSGYWGETARPSIPRQSATVGWGEAVAGLRVKLAGPIDAGWLIRYHFLLHQSRARYGRPYYIPGFGNRDGALTASFFIYYCF